MVGWASWNASPPRNQWERLEMPRASQIRRMFRRLFSAGLAWLMVPLVVWGGVPAVSCACVNCQCGAACEFHAGVGYSSAQCCQPKIACCCCGCGHCPCAAGCCCCGGSHKAPNQESTCSRLPGKSVGSQPDHRCRASVSAQDAVQFVIVKATDLPSFAAGAVQPIRSIDCNRALQSAGEFNTGPPPDLVVTLRKLVI